MLIVLSVLLALVMLAAISLQKTYDHIPVRELKRRARAGDEVATLLHSAVAFGISLRVLLWFVVGISAAIFVSTLSYAMPPPVAIFGCAAVLLFGFAWLPGSRITPFGLRLATGISPLLTGLLHHIAPVIEKTSAPLARRRQTAATKLYEKDDVLNLIERQINQSDNRLSHGELKMLSNALTFDERYIRDITTPWDKVLKVSAGDSIGPLLLDELHASGQSYFPVSGKTADELVGVLSLQKALNASDGGKVCDIMHSGINYVHQDQSLIHGLQAFAATKQHLFVVTNDFEELVGTVTIEEVLDHTVGSLMEHSFDKYDDRQAVANFRDTPTSASTTDSEMIE